MPLTVWGAYGSVFRSEYPPAPASVTVLDWEYAFASEFAPDMSSTSSHAHATVPV